MNYQKTFYRLEYVRNTGKSMLSVKIKTRGRMYSNLEELKYFSDYKCNYSNW